MTGKNILKNWFSNGKKPPQEQFWEWIDSFWHKEDKIPMNAIEGISSALQHKLDAPLFQTHIQDTDAHGITEKLGLKTDQTVFESHLNDPNAHGITDELMQKADLNFVIREIERLEDMIEGAVLTSPNGTIFKLTVDDNGTLITVEEA